MNQILNNNSNKQYFKTNADERKETFAFENNTDFKYAIHKADIIVEGNKNRKNNWDLNIEILDRFDFTDFIFPEEYNDKYMEINKYENKTQTQKAISSVKNGLGYTLNNIALRNVCYTWHREKKLWLDTCGFITA